MTAKAAELKTKLRSRLDDLVQNSVPNAPPERQSQLSGIVFDMVMKWIEYGVVGSKKHGLLVDAKGSKTVLPLVSASAEEEVSQRETAYMSAAVKLAANQELNLMERSALARLLEESALGGQGSVLPTLRGVQKCDKGDSTVWGFSGEGFAPHEVAYMRLARKLASNRDLSANEKTILARHLVELVRGKGQGAGLIPLDGGVVQKSGKTPQRRHNSTKQS